MNENLLWPTDSFSRTRYRTFFQSDNYPRFIYLGGRSK